MIIKSTFKPAWWLRNKHAQTVYSTLFRKKRLKIDKRERIELPDGDFIDLAWSIQGNDPDSPLIILLHGLGGSLNSAYVAGLLNAFNQKKWRAVFMHFRGASEEVNRHPRVYHSGDTADLDYIVEHLKRSEPNTLKGVVGISMGGNILLKWLGEKDLTATINAAVAVSVPFQLREVANRINEGFSRLYQKRLLKSLRYLLRRKLNTSNFPIPADIIESQKCFWTFDDKITAPLHGFTNVHAYYREASCLQYLSKITVPTLIIHSLDDPFMNKTVVPSESKLSSSITLEISDKGGHVGFISGKIPGKPYYWLDKRIPEFFSKTFFN